MSTLELPHLYSGKVRDLYAVGDDHLLLVASDRLSAYDVVMRESIPNKGRVLTGLTDFWLTTFSNETPSSLVSCDPSVIESFAPGFIEQTEFHGRSMLARKAKMLPLECIVRGRLAGQAWDEYDKRGTVHEMPAPSGMKLTDPFPEPIFTPSTKEDAGHDRNIDLNEAEAIIGNEHLQGAMKLCLALFTRAASLLESVGLILADTKFELGFVDGRLVVCDEVLTPDSSRIWPADLVVSGETPPAFDKQPFRDWLTNMGWDRTPPPPDVPDDVVAITSSRYVEAYERITKRPLSDWYGF